MALNKIDLLARSKREVTTVAMPGGGDVCLKPLAASVFVAALKNKGGDGFVDGAFIIAQSVCDEEGVCLFDEKKDRDAILDLPFSDFQFLVREINRINGMGEEKTGANAVPEAEKN